MLASAPSGRDQLIEEHLSFARSLAGHLARRLSPCADVEELQSDAYLGLIEAAESFDRDRGVLFRTYASRRINGAMLDGLRSRGQLRHRCRIPEFVSLSTRSFGEDGKEQTLAEEIACSSPPVGHELELKEEALAALRTWQSQSSRTLPVNRLVGLNQKEMARKLGINPSAVSQQMRRIRKCMQASEN
jgi:RNA polymerase sigma factor for flagellar operon FliA